MPFDFNAKNVFLTYPQCPLSKEEVLQSLQAKHEVSSYTVSEEKHSDGTPHVHALIVFSKRLHTSNERYFDLGVYHPNIKTLKTKSDVSRTHTYVIKDGQFITNFEKSTGKRAQLAQDIIAEGKITKKFIIEHPEVIFLNYTSISKWLGHFIPPRKALEVISQKRRHIWLDGPSNSGKTTWLYAYLSLCESPEEIPTNNDFVHVNDQTDTLYIDEYKGNLTVQSLNKLCDGNTRLNTKGGSTIISSPTIVVVSNYTIRQCYSKVEDFILDTLFNRFIQYDSSIKLPPMPRFIIKN